MTSTMIDYHYYARIEHLSIAVSPLSRYLQRLKQQQSLPQLRPWL
jgi:hypothetical protein